MPRIHCGVISVVALLAISLMPAPSRGQLYVEDFDAGNGGYSVTNGIGAGVPTGPWTYSPGRGTWFADGGEGVVNSVIDSPPILVPDAGKLALSVLHRYNFEDDGTTRWDAGQIQFSVNGESFRPVIAQAFLDGGYPTDRTIQGNSPPLNGQYAFNNTSPGFGSDIFIPSIANLGEFSAGDSLRLRFIGSWDEAFIQTPAPNWEIDAIVLEYDNNLPDLPPDRPSSLRYDIYTDIPGLLISDLRASPKFPDNPDITQTVGISEIPPHQRDFYGARLSGYFTPDQSGIYDFYMASDDQGEFYLSTDANPANAALIAREPEWNPSRDFATLTRRNPAAPENRSTTLFPDGIYLEAGQSYYVEALMKEHGGGDNLAFTAALRLDPNTPAPIPTAPLGASPYCNCGAVDLGLLTTEPVPEPASIVLAGLTAPALIWMYRRRRLAK